MEDSDNLLFNSLKIFGFQIPEGVTQLAKVAFSVYLEIGFQLSTDELLSVSIQFMGKMGMQSYEVSALKTLKGSKVRLATKVQEELLKFGVRIDIQTILNPNINETRKVIVNFLSKLSSAEEDQGRQSLRNLTYEERVQEEKLNQKTVSIQQFLSSSWINPSLQNFASSSVRFLQLHVANILNSESLIQQVANPGVRVYFFQSLASSMKVIDGQIRQRARLANKVQVFETWEGHEPLQVQVQIIKKMRRNQDPDAFLQSIKQQVDSVDDFKNEKLNWEDIQQGSRALKKAVKQMKEDDQEEETVRKVKEEENQNLFTLEIQYQQEVEQPAEQTSIVSTEPKVNQLEQDMKQMKKQMREEIEQITSELSQKEKLLDKYLAKKSKLEESVQKRMEEISQLKENNIVQQKTMENQHVILTQLEQSGGNLKELEQEIQKMEQENESIRSEWFQQKLELEGEIEGFRQKTTERKERIEQLKDKLTRLDEENQMIRNEGRNNLEKKEQLIEEFQKMPKEVGRQTYTKKIGDLRQNLDKQRNEYVKTQKEIKQVEDQIEFQNNLIVRFQTELENLFQQDPKKKEAVAQSIQKSFNDYKDIYQKQVNVIREIGLRKMEVWDMEIKTDILVGKGYKQNVEKLRNDLQEIKAENQKMAKPGKK